jgi:hypothetical protein
MENQRRRGCSASGCFFQNSTSVFRLKMRNFVTVARSHCGSKRAGDTAVRRVHHHLTVDQLDAGVTLEQRTVNAERIPW